MKIKASIIIAALAANSLFAEPMTSANIAGRTYKEILGVSLNPDGSIGVVIGSGISNFPIEDVSTEFLNSWGISEEQVEAVLRSR